MTDVRLGAQGVETGTRGALYFDDFESRRFSYIGTLPDPGVNDPTATNQAGWFTRTYAYSASIPHAVVSVTSEQSAVDSYEYDANGNMTCRIENGVVYTHAYNAENRASSIAKRNTDCTGTIIESWSFAYDGDGTRVLTAHFTGTSGTPDSVTSYFMGGQFEVKDGATKKYYSIAGMTVATQDASGLQYLLTDHLGSTVAVTNASGTLTSQSRYLPFGGVRSIPNSPILATDFGYTGQRLLDAGMGGIMDYKARFYSVALGRFIQPDSIIPDQTNPQSWNRFGYVQNNPVRFNDPTGHMLDDGCRWEGCGGGGGSGDGGGGGGGGNACDGPNPSIVCVNNGPEVSNEPEQSFEYSADLTYDFHIGPVSDEYVVEYYGDTPTNDMLGPNSCKAKGKNPVAPIFCGISLLTSFPAISSQQGNYTSNFWIHLSVNYSELNHSTYVSNLSVSSNYDGVAMLKNLYVQSGDITHQIYSTSYNYPIHPGFGSTTIRDSGGVFNATDRVVYDAEIQYRVDIGNGPFDMPQTLNITLPSLYELKYAATALSP